MSVMKDMRPRGIVKESQAAPRGACTVGVVLEPVKDEVGRAGWRRISWSLCHGWEQRGPNILSNPPPAAWEHSGSSFHPSVLVGKTAD